MDRDARAALQPFFFLQDRSSRICTGEILAKTRRKRPCSFCHRDALSIRWCGRKDLNLHEGTLIRT